MRLAIASRLVSGVTGTTTTIIEHTRRLAELDWDVHVFGEKIDRQRIEKAGGTAHRFLALPFGGGIKRRLFVWQFQRAVRKGGFDLVSGHGDSLDQDVLSLHNCVHAAHEAVHGKPIPSGSSLGKLHGRILGEHRFRHLIANSELMKQEVITRFNIREDKISVIHPGFDPERFNREGRPGGQAIREELGVPEGGLLVGLISSGDFKKRGVALFLESLGRLPLAVKDRIHTLIIGRESRLEPYRRMAAEAGMGDRTVFLDPQSKVERYLHALDLFCHPALYEEFGQSVQEALACGTPVLTSRRVGASELIGEKGREFLMVKPDAETMAVHLKTLLGDPALRRRIGDEGAAACRKNTWDHNFKKTLACYKHLLKRPG